MRLLMDIGNTRLKWALLQDELPGPQQAMAYRTDALSVQLNDMLGEVERPESVHLVSVAARQVTKEVTAWLEKHWACPIEELLTGSLCAGVVNGYKEPETLGIDRWAAMIAAYTLVNTAVCVISCGTALTCDAIDSQGRHLGGVIAPGLGLMRQSLLENTAGIRLADMERATPGWGTDTTSCVLAGGIQASIGLIDRAVKQLQEQQNDPVAVVLTGGDAQFLLTWLSDSYRYEESLVLQGVALMVREQVE